MKPNQLKLSRRTAFSGASEFLWRSRCSIRLVPSIARASESLASSVPTRMAFIFVPNGVHLADWTPREQGYGYQLPYILQPLARVQNELLVLSGLTHDKGRANGDGPGDHARSASVFLTGAQPRKTDGANIRSGISVDQMAAQAIGGRTKFASLELGCEEGRNAGGCDSGYSCAYSNNISWSSEAAPVVRKSIRVSPSNVCLPPANLAMLTRVKNVGPH